MSAGTQPRPKGTSAEVSALIEVLHTTDQRLDELLGGEVDSVADALGRTIMLRRAQGDLRHGENARQASILNALPAHIALVDRQGVIVSVNEAWRQFAGANGLPGQEHGLGLNYLDVCDSACDQSVAGGCSASAGIRAVLAGEAATFSLEYPCPSPAEGRWFRLTVTPLPGAPPNGAVVMHLNVSEQRAAADALDELSRVTSQRERMLTTMLSSIRDFAYIYDREGCFRFANRPLLDWLGLELEDILGRNLAQLGFPSQLAVKLLREVEEVFATGNAVSGEAAYTTPAGDEGWFEYVFSPAFGADGGVEFLAGTARTITRRKEAENALRASEAEFRSLASSMPQIVWATLPDGENIYVNQRWMDYTGLTLEETLGHGKWIKPFHPDDKQIALDAWQKAMATKGPYSIECRLRRADGVYHWWLLRGVHVEDAHGAVVKWIGTCTDIDELKLAEIEVLRANLELKRQQSELRALFDLVPAMIWFKDTQNNILRLNRRAAQTTGRTVEEIEGKSSLDIYPRLSAQVHAEDLQVISSGVPIMGIVQAVKDAAGNEIWIERDKVPYRDEAGNVIGIVSMAQDITQRKRDQDALRELNADLEVRVRARTAELDMARDEAERANRAKSAFLATMSHEIRTPMNGVIGMIEVLHQTSLQVHQVEMLDLIRDSAFSLLQIIEDILDFSRIEAGKLDLAHEPMQLAEIVEKVCGMLDHLAINRNVRLTMFVDPAIPATLCGDESRLRQVLINLTGNAVKFSGGRQEAGHVSVRVLMTGRDERSVCLDLVVSDDGIGIDAAALDRLFMPFSQADGSTTRRFGGSGLGLAISKMLVELMNGEISVESAVGSGSTFTVRLTLGVPRGAQDEIPTAPWAQGLRCRVVGGLRPLAEDLSSYLAREGMSVERSPDLSHATAAGKHPGLTLWLILPGEPTPGIDELRRIAPHAGGVETRFIVLEWGNRRQPRRVAADLVIADADTLFRRTLIRALGIASGDVQGEFGLYEPAAEKHDAPSRELALLQNRLILVAEDNETNQLVILRQLEVIGFAGEVAVNGLEALERWRTGDYALLLTDLHMPGMDGYALARAIRAEEAPGKHIPIIALTANALRDEELRCLAAGMDAYLSKPVRLAQLKSSVEAWLVPAADRSTPAAAPIAATPPADLGVLAALVGDDPGVIAEVLQSFRESAALSSAEIARAIASDSRQAVADAAHHLKSAAHSIGAARVGELCAAIELAAKGSPSPELKSLLPLFQAELAAVLAFLDAR